MNLDECGKRTATYAAAAADLVVGDVLLAALLAALDVVLADVCYQMVYYYQSACCTSPCEHQYLLKEHSVDSWDILCFRPLILIPHHWKEVHLYLMMQMPLSILVVDVEMNTDHLYSITIRLGCVLRFAFCVHD